nr:unnamed protein product [Callosobruchus chinensis]
MIWHEHVSSVATAAGKKLGYLFRARKYFSASNLLTLYKAQIRPSLEYCSHIWGAAAPTTLSILDAVQRRAIRLIGDPALTCHLQPLSHRRAAGDLSLFIQMLFKRILLLRADLYNSAARAWNELPGDVLVEPASIGLFKSRVNMLPLT